MAWTTISDATLEVGKALRALTMRNLRDNIAAVAAGDAGAPQIQTAAIAASAVTAAKIAAGNVLAANIGDGNVIASKIADGNVTTAKIASGAVAAWVASLGAGEVGTYALLRNANNTVSYGQYLPGTVLAGGGWSAAGGSTYTAAGGSWRLMGYSAYGTSTVVANNVSLWLRIA